MEEERAKITIEIDPCGRIVSATEDGKPLDYGDEEKKLGKTMDDGITQLRRPSNTCCWRKRNGRWVCYPC